MPKTKVGIIISDKMTQTAVIQTSRLVKHPLYNKRYHIHQHLKAHNPDNKYKEGDRVIIQETRPVSKDKNWLILRKTTQEEQE